ncbi:MAG TPA: recombinase family protein, partial [Jatrophihabitans sp.]|uniref:recombinase family protein n=1 Tax=Jatrophihabitans sp. TaxID=1932789 RepID=UPI002E03C7D4|nr:recombinase family protein [Jatrophihabitans sp.]
MRALIYARISPASADKNAPKTANQVADCDALATKCGYRVTGVFVDDNLSASTGKTRPDFERLLEAVRAGNADIVLATEEERFARNMGDKERLQLACIASGATWHTLRDGQVDPADAAGEFMGTMRAAVGRMESRRKAERQINANAHRRANGERYMQGPRIFGWMDDKSTLEKSEADLIKAGTKMILEGSTIYRVCMMFRDSGVKPIRAQAWQTVAVQNMLCRWTNAGVMSYKDVPDFGVTTDWQPIVSRKDLEAVRTILKRKGLARNRAQSLATGIAKCVCGATVVGSGANGKKFYVCTAQRAGTKNGGLHSSILFNLLDEKITEEICQAYLEEPEAVTDDSSELAGLYDRLHGLQKQQEDLLDLHLEGTLTKPIYVKKNA